MNPLRIRQHLLLAFAALATFTCAADSTTDPKDDARPGANPAHAFEHRIPSDLKQTPDTEVRLDKWYRDAKYGAFIHFGVYSMLEGGYKGRGESGGYAEWVRYNAKMTQEEHLEVTAQFNPSEFDAREWVALFKDCGIKYVVITAKHHDGFALYDSAVSDHNIVDATPFKRDVIKELSEACHAAGLKFGVYYSHAQDWVDPNAPLATETRTKRGEMHPDLRADFQPDIDKYIQEKSLPQVKELMKNYVIDLIWFDTPVGISQNNRFKLFYDAVRENNPDCLINSRLLYAGRSKISQDKLQWFDYVSVADKEVADQVLPIYYESPDSITTSYGYKTKGRVIYHTEAEMIHRLINTVCTGGNYLLNNGPMGNGRLDPKAVDIYKAIGAWLQVNGEAVYATRANPLPSVPDWGNISISKDGGKLYLHVMQWPENGSLTVDGMTAAVNEAFLLADPEKRPLQFNAAAGRLALQVPASAPDSNATVICLILEK